MTNEEFYKSLSEADWETACAIEKEIGKLLEQGLSENVALTFTRTVMEARKAVPGATVEGVFEVAMNAGLICLGSEHALAEMRGVKKRKSKTPKLASTLK